MAKELVRQISFCDGKETNRREKMRTVYRPKNGTPYVRDKNNKKVLIVAPDGVFELEYHAKSIPVLRVWDIFGNKEVPNK